MLDKSLPALTRLAAAEQYTWGHRQFVYMVMVNSLRRCLERVEKEMNSED